MEKKLNRNYSPTKYFKNKRFRRLVNDKKVRKEKLVGAQKKARKKISDYVLELEDWVILLFSNTSSALL